MTSTDNSARNKRIAKNTILLYIRMLFLMLISLYTSRVILNALGVEDFGIYNVVGGLVSMFSMISASLNASIYRFLTFELGKRNKDKLRKVFSTSVTIQIILSLIVVVLAETLGLWFLNYKMVIPDSRLVAANWCFQFTILTFVINLISVPYNAAIIAHERMSAFAYISIFEAISKLIIACLLLVSPIDRLIFYSALIASVSIIVRLAYTRYCNRFEECHYHFYFNYNLLKQMFGFAGWNFIGAASTILRDQGGNIIINLFCGPTVNAARGISIQINNAVSGFVNNFMTALNPQITKSYASGDFDYMFKLIYKGARFSYYILLIIALPIIFSTQYLLELWLGIVPEHADTFAQLILILTLTDSLANPLVTVMLATGDIKKYQIVVGGLQLINLPMYYIFLLFGYPPECVFVISIMVSFLSEIARIIMLKDMIGLSVMNFLKNVILNVICVTLIASIIPFLFKVIYWHNNFVFFCLMSLITLISTLLCVFFIGCSKQERLMICQYGGKLIRKFR